MAVIVAEPGVASAKELRFPISEAPAAILAGTSRDEAPRRGRR
jgi:hypothetical protein